MRKITVTGRSEEEAIGALIDFVKKLVDASLFVPSREFTIWQEGMYWIAEISAVRTKPATYNVDGCVWLCERLCTDARREALAGSEDAMEWLKDGWVSRMLAVSADEVKRSFARD